MTGLELARRFFAEAVEPLVASVAPDLRFSAGLLGDGSDVLGYDDDVSRDHGWGPRCQLLLDRERRPETVTALDDAFTTRLPLRFLGYPTSYAGYHLDPIAAPPIRHWIDMATPEEFLRNELGVADARGLSPRDWLALRSHKLAGVVGGELFRDDLDFAATRRVLAAYPDDVRLYFIAAEWMKIADEQAFPARAGSVGDESGSAIVAARLAEGLMRIGFHLMRTYAPYGKWFGSAFARLARCTAVAKALARMLTARGWQERDRAWAQALAAALALHEEEGLVARERYVLAPVYIGRPGTGLPQFERGGPPSIMTLIDEIRGRIADPEIRALAQALEPA